MSATHCIIHNFRIETARNGILLHSLTRAPSSWKMADAPSRPSGAIFLLQRLRRNVSEERSNLWKFQPIREENSQPSGSPLSCLCCTRNKSSPIKKSTPGVTFRQTSLETRASVERRSAVSLSPPQLLLQLHLFCEVERVASCDGRGRPSQQGPRTEVCHLGE